MVYARFQNVIDDKEGLSTLYENFLVNDWGDL